MSSSGEYLRRITASQPKIIATRTDRDSSDYIQHVRNICNSVPITFVATSSTCCDQNKITAPIQNRIDPQGLRLERIAGCNTNCTDVVPLFVTITGCPCDLPLNPVKNAKCDKVIVVLPPQLLSPKCCS